MKTIIILLIIGGIAFAVFNFLKSDTGKDTTNFVYDTQSLDTKNTIEPDLAVLRAKEVWQIAVNSGDDLSQGPCLTNSLINGWVLDIAHNPREAIDDLPKNQCSAYLNGTAKHFVELDVEGNLLRAE